jgi:dienelactone hydrolase
MAMAMAMALALAGCAGAGARNPAVVLAAAPVTAPFDTPVTMSIRGLEPGSTVTVRATTRDYQNRPWNSWARFLVAEDGGVNLGTQRPIAGTYHVADAAGLIWSLQPGFTAAATTQFYIGGGDSMTIRLTAIAGNDVVAEATLHREFGVMTRTITTGEAGFYGTLFTPPGPVSRAAAGVVIVSGSAGGEDGLTAGALALVGHPALSLAYFKEPGLPQCLCSISLNYFSRAIEWLRAQPSWRNRPIVIFGESFGTEAVLLTGAYFPHLTDAIVADSPSAIASHAFGGTGDAWTVGGRPVAQGSPIPVARIRIPLLISDGGQDDVWDSAGAASQIMQTLRTAHDPAVHINLYYPQAGHGAAGEPPDFPFTLFGANYDYLGGSPAANAEAAESFWPRLLGFLNGVR